MRASRRSISGAGIGDLPGVSSSMPGIIARVGARRARCLDPRGRARQDAARSSRSTARSPRWNGIFRRMSWSSARAPRASPPPCRRATTAPRSIVVEENFDIGGHAMLSGGRVQLGGGNALQKKFGIKDSPDQVLRRLGQPRRAATAATTTATWCARSPTSACRPSSSCSTTASPSSRSRSSRPTPRPCRACSSPTNGTSRAR